MPAWIVIVVLAAVAFVAWFGFGRRWWHSLWYSWHDARHLADLTQTELIPGAEFLGSMSLTDEILARFPDDTRALGEWLSAPVDPDPWETRLIVGIQTASEPAPDWRQQMTAELSPEALDPGPRQFLTTIPGTRMTIYTDGGIEFTDPPDDPGPGGGASDLSSSPLSGPDQQTPLQAQMAAILNRREPTRLAGTGDIAAAHEAHPEPFGLMEAIRAAEDAGGGIVAIPPGTYGPFFHTSAEGQAAWLEAQMAVLFGWVRVMVPQVTGWSVST